MSESQKKFSYFAPDANAHSQKALRVDAVAEAKDNVNSVTRALSLGKMPTTDQITEALTTARNARTLRDEVQLSESGQQVSDKFDQVLDSTRRLVLDKNRGNEIQNLIYHSKLAEKNLDKKTPSFKAERGDTKEDLNNAYNHLLILSRLIITSSQFRGLLADFYSLIRETLVMNDVNYSRDLPSVAELTDDQGGLDAALAKESARRLTKDLKDDIYDNLDEESRNHLDRARSGEKKLVAIDLAHKGAQELAKSIKPVVDKASEGNTVDAANMTQHKAKEINHRAQSSKDKYKVRAEDFADKADDKLQDIYKDLRLTDVEKDQLIERLISIINEIQTNKEMQKAIDGLIEVLANLKSTSQIIKDRTVGKAQNEAESNEDLEYAVANAKRAIENFAGHHSLDPLIKMVSNFANEVDSNSELSNLMHKNHVFLLSSLKDPSFTKQNNYDEIALERFQETRKLLLGVKYQQKVRELMGELRSLIVDIKEDPLTNRAITDLEHLTSEIFLDKNGRPTIKHDLLQDFHKFVPALSNRLRRIKIPRVEEQDNHGEYILDNIFLECDNIVPAQARVRTDTQFDSGEEYIQNVISIQLQGVKAEAKDVAFYFNRKVSILGNMEDSGLVNVSVGGDGLDIFLKIAPKTISVNKNLAPVDTRAFRILDLTCRVNDIRVSFQFGKYKLLYRMFNRMIQNNVKREIEKMVVEGIRNFLDGVEENISNPDAKLSGAKCDPKPMNTLNEGWKTDIFGKN